MTEQAWEDDTRGFAVLTCHAPAHDPHPGANAFPPLSAPPPQVWAIPHAALGGTPCLRMAGRRRPYALPSAATASRIHAAPQGAV